MVLVSKIGSGFSQGSFHGSSNYKRELTMFFPIKFFNHSVACLPFFSDFDEISDCDVEISKEKEESWSSVIFKHFSNAPADLLDSLDYLCLNHLSGFASIASISACTTSNDQLRDFVSLRVFSHSRNDLCLKAVLCNALGSVNYHEEALTVPQTKIKSGSLACVGSEMEKVLWPFCLCKNQDFDYSRDPADFLESHTSKVYLVRIKGVCMGGDSEMDYVIAIDEDKRVIWDCFE